MHTYIYTHTFMMLTSSTLRKDYQLIVIFLILQKIYIGHLNRRYIKYKH